MPEKDSLRWTVNYHAMDDSIITRENVLFYELQEAIHDCSREAYEKGTSCNFIQIL